MSGRITVSAKSERTVDGITFASKAEMRRWCELKMMERAGLVSNLKRQTEFVLQKAYVHRDHGTQRAIKYFCDFEYDYNGKHYVEDCKGHKTEIYRIKKKMLLYLYPSINFVEGKVHA